MKFLIKNRYVIDFVATVMFFTRIPVNWSHFSNKAPVLTRAAWAFPLIGLLIGFFSGISGDFLILVGVSTFLSCVFSITVSVLITGAFHEDGLADTADGLGAGGPPNRINKIIHDSRLGTYGVCALILALLSRFGIMLSLLQAGYSLVTILSIGFASGKFAIIIARNFFRNSKFAKTGSIIGVVSNKNVFIATIIWIVPCYLIFPLYGIFLGFFFLLFIVFILGKKSKVALGGLTGDILGAISFLGEIAFLLGIVVVIT